MTIWFSAGSKEASFIRSLTSAALSFVIARACREGWLSHCGCGQRLKPKSLPQEWLWGGCSDNLKYAAAFGVDFVDARERETNRPKHSKELAVLLSNLHNYALARRVCCWFGWWVCWWVRWCVGWWVGWWVGW